MIFENRRMTSGGFFIPVRLGRDLTVHHMRGPDPAPRKVRSRPDPTP